MSASTDVKGTQDMLEVLRSHDGNEVELLDAYRSVADSDPDDGVRYLVSLIIDDEERHHRLLAEMADRLESWTATAGSGTPALSPRVDRALLDTTRQLIARERADAKELRRLRHEFHNLPKASLLPLLVDLMLRDTTKHIRILRFIRTYSG